MARQTATQTELDNVFDNDFETFILPIDASLDLEQRTVYGTTDPSLGLSMVNVRHLNNTRSFRGPWQMVPTDGALEDAGLAYKRDEVVIGSDSQLYIRQDPADILDPETGMVVRSSDTPNAVPVTQNPDPTTETALQPMRAWMQIGGVELEEAVTELTSTPATQELNLFTAAAHTARFNVEPTADAVLVAPVETSLTVEGTIVNGDPVIPPFNIPNDELSVVIPNGQTDSNAVITVTTAARSTSDSGTHEGGQVDSEITFVDARINPETTLRGDNRVSRVRFGTTLPEDVVFDTTLTPNGASVPLGTAFHAGWVATPSGPNPATAQSNIDGSYTLPPINIDTMVEFTYPFVGAPANGQLGSPQATGQNFMINAYTPWFWTFITPGTTPTDLTGFTQGMLVGETRGSSFPTNSTSEFQVVGPVGVRSNLWFAVPTSVNSIALRTGAALVPALNMGNTITAPLADGSGNAMYNLHVVNFGLVTSPTTFTISST